MDSPAISFSKYEGLGNDFIILHKINLPIQQRILLCDRHFGVGADGVIIVTDSQRPGVLARMQVTNADGSIPEMCGNGFRCVARWLRDNQQVNQGVIETDAGDRSFVWEGDNCVVDMGIAQLGECSEGSTEVSMGNPHLVLELEADESLARRIGSQHPDTNVGFAHKLNDGEINLRVHERGVGLTLACGTGACAAVAAFVSKGMLPRDVYVKVNLPGGTLWVSIDEKNRVTMKGPARRLWLVSSCQFELP